MKVDGLKQVGEWRWELAKQGSMLVPGVVYGDESVVGELDDAVCRQLANVASLPGIVTAAFAMPDAHWGYGFPIGGVGAFDAERDGVVSAGGVGFDISCGVRTLLTDLDGKDVRRVAEKLADALARRVPAGVGSTGKVQMNGESMTAMLRNGARWAVERGYGSEEDLDRIEDCGVAPGARPEKVSERARRRQVGEMGTLGSGNHYLEVQEVREIYDVTIAGAFGLSKGMVVVSVHCGSRGLGHQVATEYSQSMVASASRYGIGLRDRELACAPIRSPEGEAYLGAMRSAINCALANRQILGHLVREVFGEVFKRCAMPLLYDVSHNTCRLERHEVDGAIRELYVHRKGATRAFGPGHPELPAVYRAHGQPVLIGGTMGTASYVMAGCGGAGGAFASACHGAGRRMSRTQAMQKWQGKQVVDELSRRGIAVRCATYRGIAEEAPGAYKDVAAVVEATHAAGLARKVARVVPLVCVKG